MDFTVLPPALCPSRRAGGDRTPPARPLRVSLNPACVSRPVAIAPSSSAAAADPTPPARSLRVRSNPACVSMPTAAATKKPKRPGLPCNEEPPTTKKKPKRPGLPCNEEPCSGGAGEGKENKDARTATAAAKAGTLLWPCRWVDGAPGLPLGSATGGLGRVGTSAAPAPAAKRKATPADSELAPLRPCCRGDGAPRSALGSTTARLHAGARSPAAKRRAIHSRPTPTRRRGASPIPSTTTRSTTQATGASGAAASASPSPLSPESGGTVRELLETARTVTDAIRRREIERLRAQARRELERVVRTVEFNDPFLSPQDVLR